MLKAVTSLAPIVCSDCHWVILLSAALVPECVCVPLMLSCYLVCSLVCFAAPAGGLPGPVLAAQLPRISHAWGSHSIIALQRINSCFLVRTLPLRPAHLFRRGARCSDSRGWLGHARMHGSILIWPKSECITISCMPLGAYGDTPSGAAVLCCAASRASVLFPVACSFYSAVTALLCAPIVSCLIADCRHATHKHFCLSFVTGLETGRTPPANYLVIFPRAQATNNTRGGGGAGH